MKRRLAGYGVALISACMLLVAQAPVGSAHAQAVRYRPGFSVQGAWLCYGWLHPAIYHCTRHWYWRSGHAYSMTAFVPRVGTQATHGAAITRRQPTSRASHQATPQASQPQAPSQSGQPCQGGYIFPAIVSAWAVPHGCYAGIYTPNPRAYPARPSYGWCNWWPEVLNPAYGGYAALHLPDHSLPRLGATVFFAPFVQGASSAGHYARVVAISPAGYWVLITEMNFYWRGGGFGRVDYRYIHLGAGVSFRY